MESRAKLFGHSIHQMLVVLPLGLLVMAVIFDIIYKATGNTGLASVAYWDIAAGIVSGLVAAVFGFWDWLHIPAGTRAKAIGAWHGGGNVVVIILFAANWLLRRDNAGHAPDTLAFALELIALAGGAITGWLGGELVDRLGVGVDPGANLSAPSSLSGRPARQG
jgi:uncharacterized membrane protein